MERTKSHSTRSTWERMARSLKPRVAAAITCLHSRSEGEHGTPQFTLNGSLRYTCGIPGVGGLVQGTFEQLRQPAGRPLQFWDACLEGGFAGGFHGACQGD
jgi:hypothetical protein